MTGMTYFILTCLPRCFAGSHLGMSFTTRMASSSRSFVHVCNSSGVAVTSMPSLIFAAVTVIISESVMPFVLVALFSSTLKLLSEPSFSTMNCRMMRD